jgi:SAM-dependent methyltransferase
MNKLICPLCLAGLDAISHRGNYVIWQCKNCKLNLGSRESSNLKPDSGVVRTAPEHFSMLHHQYQEHVSVMKNILAKRSNIFNQYLGPSERNWLEIGPGNGSLSDALNPNDSWVGVEFDSVMAQAMIHRGLNVVNADFSDVGDPLAYGSNEVKNRGGFDVVSLSQVFEHVSTPLLFLQNAYRALRPGGLLYLDVPNNRGITAVIRKMNIFSSGYGEVVPPHHLFAYSSNTIKYALKAVGFEVILCSAFSYSHHTFGLVHAHMNKSRLMRLVWGGYKYIRRWWKLSCNSKKTT